MDIDDDDDDDDVHYFPLFAKLRSSAPDTRQAYQRIVLRSPSPPTENPGFCVPRPESYYLTGLTSKEKSEQYRLAAVTGHDVVQRLQEKWVRQKLDLLINHG